MRTQTEADPTPHQQLTRTLLHTRTVGTSIGVMRQVDFDHPREREKSRMTHSETRDTTQQDKQNAGRYGNHHTDGTKYFILVSLCFCLPPPFHVPFLFVVCCCARCLSLLVSVRLFPSSTLSLAHRDRDRPPPILSLPIRLDSTRAPTTTTSP